MKNDSFSPTPIWLAIIFLVVSFSVIPLITKKEPPQADQIQQLQTEVQQLRTEMDDVKHVQGFMPWEQEWKRYKEWKVTHP